MKLFLPIISLLALAGCAGSIHEPTPPRMGVKTVKYEHGMQVNMHATHINAKGNVVSMYDPVVHCHTLYYPGKAPERICRLVK